MSITFVVEEYKQPKPKLLKPLEHLSSFPTYTEASQGISGCLSISGEVRVSPLTQTCSSAITGECIWPTFSQDQALKILQGSTLRNFRFTIHTCKHRGGNLCGSPMLPSKGVKPACRCTPSQATAIR